MTTPMRLRDLASALFPAWCQHRPVFVFKYYLDESARDDVFAVGGYLGHVEQWSNFEDEWNPRLRQAEVEVFHATDLNSARGEFKGWDTAKKIKFSKYFTAIAEKQTELAIGRAVELSAFHEIMAPRLAEALWTPHGRFTPMMWCTRLCLESLVEKWGRYLHNEPLVVVFEQGDGVGETIEYLRGLQRRGLGWVRRITSFADGPKSLVPLQAADLVSHEAMRTILEILAPTGRPPRKSMVRLTRTDRLELKVYTRQGMATAVTQIEERAAPSERRTTPEIPKRRKGMKRWQWWTLVGLVVVVALTLLVATRYSLSCVVEPATRPGPLGPRGTTVCYVLDRWTGDVEQAY